MQWTEFLGHQRQRNWFANALANGKLASTFLMVGPQGVGKRTFAKLVAKSLLCTQTDPRELSFCNHCETCLQIERGSHPDILYLCRPKDKTGISMEQLVGAKDARMREGFCYELRIRPYSGRRKIAILDDADTLEDETSNSLLKTLEEPPPGALIFLLGTSEKRQISTIRSRSQIVRFSPLSNEHVQELILRHQIVEDPVAAEQLALRSHGSISHASELNDPNLIEFREQIFKFLGQRPIEFIPLIKAILDHLNNSTAEGQPRRERFTWCMDEVTASLRLALQLKLGVPMTDRMPTANDVPLKDLPVRSLVKLIEITQETRENIYRYIAPAALLEAWTTNFVRIARL